MASKKKEKGKNKKNKQKITKQFTKHLKRIIKVHGTELALGFVTGIITKLISEKVAEPKSGKKTKATAEEQPAIVTAVKKATKAVAQKVQATVAPKNPTVRKTPVRKAAAAKPLNAVEPAQ